MQQHQKQKIKDLDSCMRNLKSEVLNYQDTVSIQYIINDIYTTNHECINSIAFKEILEGIIDHITNFKCPHNNNNKENKELSIRMKYLIEFVYWLKNFKDKAPKPEYWISRNFIESKIEISEESYKKFLSFFVENKKNIYEQNTRNINLNNISYPNITWNLLIESRDILIGKKKNLSLKDNIEHYLEKIIYADIFFLPFKEKINIENEIKINFDLNHWSAIKDRIVQTKQKFCKSESQTLLQNLIKQLDLMQIRKLEYNTIDNNTIDMLDEIKKLSPKKSTVNKRKPFQEVNFDQYVISDDQTTSIIVLSKIFKQYCEFIYFKIVKCNKDNLEKTLLDEQKIFLQDKIEKFEMNNKKHNNNNMLTKKNKIILIL